MACAAKALHHKCLAPKLTLDSSNLLPFRTLGALAEKCHAFAKALHYKEYEYATTPGTAVEALISINNQLRQPEAAIGILTMAQQTLHMELKVNCISRAANMCCNVLSLARTSVQ